ncbi:DNA polymerase-3 subunit gamma/tau [Flexibacter flexilis DSM 6793]|uniref:DNA polymerase III subunit gamma/tau n=1 Tax=Flexibacter flexilis DSM 6793 TaxID=927664 RepID=A0A1I1DMN5_9BACT|nr:DNA polymerase III subunit gamma/tau [Flexibacter flexilis]SFB74338.1 DNA polymerase-3 subunit gamma/tau [Flexibacter flexilis DSM 6793]
MEKFIVSARKYRPAQFDSVVGQSHITTTLKNAIANNHLAQAFLFCGPRGVGKTTCARILAKTINCTNLTPEHEACNECESCVSFNNNASFNTHELDAASNNSVDDIRNLVEQVRYAPQSGRYKVYIIDEVHMLSNAAFNAFLKTLEEPPSYAIFILATTEKHKIIPTILSRCQIFDFNRIHLNDIAGHLAGIAQKEHIIAEPEALRLIAQKADGGLRDALSLFDLISTFAAGRGITYAQTIENLHILDYDYYFKITDSFLQENLPQSLLIFDEILRKGFDGHNFIVGLSEHLRNLMVCKDAATVRLLEVSEDVQQRYLQQAQNASVSFLLTALNVVSGCDMQYKNSKNQRLLVELALMKICYLQRAIDLAQAPTETVSSEEKKKPNPQPVVSGGAVPTTPNIAPPPAHLKTATRIPTAAELATKAAQTQPAAAMPTAVTQPTATPQPATTPVVAAAIITNNDFSFEQLQTAWQAFAEILRNKQDYANLATVSNKEYKLQGQQIVLQVFNPYEQKQFADLKPQLLGFLREQLHNNLIDVLTEIKPPSQEQLVAHSPQDKFARLLEKYPLVQELRDRLNLDIQ